MSEVITKHYDDGKLVCTVVENHSPREPKFHIDKMFDSRQSKAERVAILKDDVEMSRALFKALTR